MTARVIDLPGCMTLLQAQHRVRHALEAQRTDQRTPLGDIIAAHVEVPAGTWLRTALDIPRPTGRDEVWLQVNSTALFSVIAFLGDQALVRRLDKGNGRAFWRPAAGLQRHASSETTTKTN